MSDIILDEEYQDQDYVLDPAPKGTRFANYILDIIFYAIGFTIISIVVDTISPDLAYMMAEEEPSATLFTILFYLAYFTLTEYYFGKTLAKFITRTKVVKEDGSRPEFINIVGRSFARLIPFDAFSYLGVSGRGWHDTLPNVYVVRDNNR